MRRCGVIKHIGDDMAKHTNNYILAKIPKAKHGHFQYSTHTGENHRTHQYLPGGQNQRMGTIRGRNQRQ